MIHPSPQAVLFDAGFTLTFIDIDGCVYENIGPSRLLELYKEHAPIWGQNTPEIFEDMLKQNEHEIIRLDNAGYGMIADGISEVIETWRPSK